MSFKDRHNDAYLIVSTILTTLLGILTLGLIIFVVSLVIGVVMFVFIAGIVIAMLASSDTSSSSSKETTMYEVYEDGWRRELRYDSRDWGSGGDRYKDDRGDYWITEDDGRTFYREK